MVCSLSSPSMKRLTVLLLLLLLLPWSSNRGVDALDLWVTRGRLPDVTSSLAALAQLSKNLQQATTWWQLTSTEWHPEALWRFMVLGPPPINVLPGSSRDKEQVTQILNRGGLAGTREAAVAEYVTEVGRAGTGSIQIAAWALMYNCLNKDCDIVAPVILAKSPDGKNNYGTLWQNVFDSSSSRYSNPVLLSANTADIVNRTHLVPPHHNPSRNLGLRVAHDISQCNESLAFGRSPLDAAYKLLPGLCYELHETLRNKLNQSHLFVVLEDEPHEVNWPYKRRPLQECSVAPVLIKSLNYYRTCVFSELHELYYCANFTLSDYDDSTCKAQKLPIALSNFLLVYSYINNQTSAEKLTQEFMIVNDTAPGAPCNTSGRTRVAIYGIKRNGFSLTHSIWEDTNGSRTEEFNFGRPNGSFCYYGVKSEEKENNSYLRRCNISTTLNTTVSRCDITAVDHDLLDIMFNETVTAYADEHNTAFNMDKGPATDLFTAWAALVTAAVSVLTATIPCTNLELEYLARFVFPKKHEKLKLLKFSFVALVNVAFGMILYAPIFAMILNESKRSETYYTWSVVNNDVNVNTYGTQMRTVFIIEGESNYKSKIFWLFLVVCAISFPLIVLLTLKRCYKVFYRRRLLLLARDDADVPLSNAEAKEINVKAIEMGLSEFVRLNEQLKQPKSMKRGAGLS